VSHKRAMTNRYENKSMLCLSRGKKPQDNASYNVTAVYYDNVMRLQETSIMPGDEYSGHAKRAMLAARISMRIGSLVRSIVRSFRRDALRGVFFAKRDLLSRNGGPPFIRKIGSRCGCRRKNEHSRASSMRFRSARLGMQRYRSNA